MVDTERGQRHGRPKVRRTEEQLRRRQALADAAAGLSPGGTDDVLARAARIKRFRCVIYLCGATSADFAAARQGCAEYAEAFGWEITHVIEEPAGSLRPLGRDGLGRAVEIVKTREAGVVLTASRSMISSLPQECDEVVREIESAGGFVHVMGSAGSRAT